LEFEVEMMSGGCAAAFEIIKQLSLSVLELQ